MKAFINFQNQRCVETWIFITIQLSISKRSELKSSYHWLKSQKRNNCCSSPAEPTNPTRLLITMAMIVPYIRWTCSMCTNVHILQLLSLLYNWRNFSFSSAPHSWYFFNFIFPHMMQWVPDSEWIEGLYEAKRQNNGLKLDEILNSPESCGAIVVIRPEALKRY